MEEFIQTETSIIELLLVLTIVAMVVRRLRIPYTVALVVIGLGLTSSHSVSFELTPELIMALFVPPLVFEAAFHINATDLRRELPAVLLLAVPGVILTTCIVGLLVAWTTPLSLPLALVFGALIAATDPVAVVALFRTLGVPKRLALMVEGESLLNDGTAIVVFNLMLAVALTGHFDAMGSVVDFVWVAAGGLLIGTAFGWVISRVIASVDDYLIETTLTTLLAFGAYLAAERGHVSGVLAVVAAGLVNGNLGPRGMSPTTRIVLFNFWEYVAFLANSLVFLLIGLKIDVLGLVDNWQPIVAAVGAVLAARVVVVYGLGMLTNRLAEPIPLRWQHVLTWSGLRGAISLALVLALPDALGADRDLLRIMAFGVVLFTLLGQGMTMGPILRRLRLVVRSESGVELETRRTRLAVLRAGQRHMDAMHRQGLFSTHTWEALKPALEERASALSDEVRKLLQANKALEAQEVSLARKELLRAQRGALLTLRRDGMVSDEAFEKLATEIDEALDAVDTEETPMPELLPTEDPT